MTKGHFGAVAENYQPGLNGLLKKLIRELSNFTENSNSFCGRSTTPNRVIQNPKDHKFKYLSNATGPIFLWSSNNFT